MSLRAAQPLIFLAALCMSIAKYGQSQSIYDCQALTDHYLEKHHKEAVPYTGGNLLYFLHVPRTAGRTFHSCLLKISAHPARRCPKAYDHLRLTNMSSPNCYLLSSHDDFSVVSMLPPDVAVLTQIRDPVDRFLSAYEFAIEVAARTFRRPKKYRKAAGKIATEDVWPWSYLVPFFTADMAPKVAAANAVKRPPGGRWITMGNADGRWYYNKVLNESRSNLTAEEAAQGGGVLPLFDPYDNDLVISLKDFALHPIASELLHNGAAFQILGITNYSHWGDAGTFRSCLLQHDSMRGHMLSVAQERIKRFTHVGTTDRLYDSASSAIVSMGLTVESPAYSGGDEDVAGRGGAGRRRYVEEGGDRDGRAGTNGGRMGSAAARMQLLAKLIREARRRLQTAQKELVDAQRSHSDDSVLSILRSKVDNARNELIEAQERLAELREQLPAALGGKASAGSGLASNIEDGAAQAARRRLMMADEGGDGQFGSTSSTSVSEDSVHRIDGDVTERSVGSDSGTDSRSEAVAEEEAAEVAVEQQRRLLVNNKIVIPSTDAFGNTLDPDFKRIANSNVGTEFVRCASRAHQRSVARRDQSLAGLSHPDGRQVLFSKWARRQIPKEVIELIRSHNTLDTALHEQALMMLDARIAEQKAERLYVDVPADAADEKIRKKAARGNKQQEQRQTVEDELR